MSGKSFKTLFEEAEKHLDYWVAGAEIEFTEELARVMDEQGVTRAELARRIGTSQAYITKVLRGDVNFTLATMVKLARAFDMDLKLHLARQGAQTRWEDVGLADWEAPSRAQADVGSAREASGARWSDLVDAGTSVLGGPEPRQSQVTSEVLDVSPTAAA